MHLILDKCQLEHTLFERLLAHLISIILYDVSPYLLIKLLNLYDYYTFNKFDTLTHSHRKRWLCRVPHSGLIVPKRGTIATWIARDRDLDR